MAAPFCSDEVETINRQISFENQAILEDAVNLELDRCAKWILDHNFLKIALQFPNDLLSASATVVQELAQRTSKLFFVLADTSSGCCCVDEIAAAHVSADAIIHFGHACLSTTQGLPVLYVFGKCKIDVPNAISAFKQCFPDTSSHVIIYYEVNYQHAIGQISENLKAYKNLVISELVISHEDRQPILSENQVKIVRNQRYFILPQTKDLQDYTVFYIGHKTDQSLNNVMLSLYKCKFCLYNPLDKTVSDDTRCLTRFIKQRYYYIERTRDAKIIGIIVRTLGASNYLSTIKQLRGSIKAANKKPYTFVVGKINVAKLANFAEIEIFVNVACLESTVVDCSEFYQPIITPYELEVALNRREWTGGFITDSTELLPGGPHYVPLCQTTPEIDVSLITGKIRYLGLSDASDEVNDESAALVQRNEMVVSEIHSQAAGEYLTQRSWRGLEQNLGETPAVDIQKGRKGIASGYEDEGAEST